MVGLQTFHRPFRDRFRNVSQPRFDRRYEGTIRCRSPSPGVPVASLHLSLGSTSNFGKMTSEIARSLLAGRPRRKVVLF